MQIDTTVSGRFDAIGKDSERRGESAMFTLLRLLFDIQIWIDGLLAVVVAWLAAELFAEFHAPGDDGTGLSPATDR